MFPWKKTITKHSYKEKKKERSKKLLFQDETQIQHGDHLRRAAH
jgi:hypothetical protein